MPIPIRFQHWYARLEERALGLRDFERMPSLGGAFTVMSDDGETRNLELAEVLAKAGVPGAFSVAGDNIGRDGFLSYAQLRELQAAGHEILFHGRAGARFSPPMNVAAVTADAKAGRAELEAEGLQVRNLNIRWGTSTRAARAAMAALFDSAFVPWFGVNDAASNRFALRRMAFGAYAGGNMQTEAWYRDLIERAVRDKLWPVLMLHPGAADHTADHNALLLRLLQHAKAVGLPVRTPAQQWATVARSRSAAATSGTSRSAA